MWNLRGLVPESPTRIALTATLLAFSALACGPSNSGTPATYIVTFALGSSPEDLAKLAFRVVYVGGEFTGDGASVVCSLLATDDNETADFVDDDNGELEVQIDATDNALAEGSEIVECEFIATDQPTANQFTITVESAEDDFGDPVDKNDVDVVVTSTDLK